MTKQEKIREILEELYSKGCRHGLGVEDNPTKENINQALSQISALDEIDEGKLKIVCEEALNDGLHYLGCVGSRLNDIDREVIKNYLAKALKESNPNDR